MFYKYNFLVNGGVQVRQSHLFSEEKTEAQRGCLAGPKHMAGGVFLGLEVPSPPPSRQAQPPRHKPRPSRQPRPRLAERPHQLGPTRS